MWGTMMLSRFLLLSVLVSQFVILVLFAVLTGAATAEVRYSDLGIPFGKEIIIGAALYLIVVGLIYRNRSFSFSLPLLLYVLLLLSLREWGKLSSVVTGREFSQFDFFFLLSIAGLLIGTSKARQIVEMGVKISATVISISILLIGLSPDLVGALTIYDPTRLEELGTGAGIFFKNSGILLNNNSLGAVITAIFAYLVFVKSIRPHHGSTNKILILMLVSVVLSGNATGSILCLLLYFYSAVAQRQKSFKDVYFVSTAIAATVLLVLYVSLTFNSGYLEYKTESIAAKYIIFFDNLSYLFGNYTGLVFGLRGEAELSESTLIDFLYYFGFPGMVILLLLFSSGSLLASHSKPYSGIRVQSWPIYIVLLTLLLVQNSVFLPPVSFIFGVLLSYSSTKVTNYYQLPSRSI